MSPPARDLIDVPDFYCDEVLSGHTPVRVVAETDDVLAFHHVFATWELHVVAIPKRHVRRLVDVEDPALVGAIFAVLAQVIRDLGLAESGYKIITNGGSFQSNQHLHFHLVAGAPLDPANPAQQGELAARD